VLVLPEGQFVVNKNIIISKFISVKGQGLSKTILFRSESVTDATLVSSSWLQILQFNINSNVSSKIVVSGICFKSKKPSMVSGDGLSRAADIGIEFFNCLDFVVTGCRFENFGNGAISVRHDDSIVGGLIYKNQFVHNVKGADALGLGYGVVIYGANKKWLASPRFGTSNFIFVENNYFEYHKHSIAAGGCALYVFRYNYVYNNTAGDAAHAIDAHGATLQSGGNYYSTRAIEVYKDSIVNTQFRDGTNNVANGTLIKSVSPTSTTINWLTEAAIKTRGGEALIHHNYIEGYRYGVGLIADSDLSGSYPLAYQQGYLSGKRFGANHTGVASGNDAGDNFIWEIDLSYYIPSNSANDFFYNYSSTTYLKRDRDYHFNAPIDTTTYTYPHPLRGSALVLTTSKTDASCNKKGSASVLVSGGSVGTLNYKYEWSTSPVKTTAKVDSLTAGAYTVKVTDSDDNSVSATITIMASSTIVLDITTSSENCGKQDGAINLTISGGTPPYTYLWNTGQTTSSLSGITSQDYTVKVTDANYCTQTNVVNVMTNCFWKFFRQ
jgi:SprB repeat